MEDFLKLNDVIARIFGVGVIGGLVGIYRVVKKIKEQKEEQDRLDRLRQQASDNALKAILHNLLYNQCQVYLFKGVVTLDELEEMDQLFQPYKALGGNGTAENIYYKIKKLPIKREEE